ncbi:hypothetical protein [Virgibacillus halodenitrificans]|uniref:hypothetical protein n=1 Tax=Virgibacillus halodenitrificans TaxID=1482 RepID=UPI003075C2C0
MSNPLKSSLEKIETIAQMYQSEFKFITNDQGKYFFDLLAGTRDLKQIILKRTVQPFFEACDKELEDFKKQRESYLLYK